MGRPYYLKRGEHVFGPYTSIKLYEEARSGGLRKSDLVARSDTGPWTEVIRVKGLDFPDSTHGTPSNSLNEEDLAEESWNANIDLNQTNKTVEEESDEVELSTSLKILGVLLMLSCVSELAWAGFGFLMGYVLLGCLGVLAVIVDATVIWGLSKLNWKVTCVFYVLPFITLLSQIVGTMEGIEASNSFNDWMREGGVLTEQETQSFEFLDVLMCFVRPIFQAVSFTAFIWWNRKLFK
jgi:hypothetical protein